MAVSGTRGFNVGDKFASFEEVQAAMREVQEKHLVNFYITNSQTIGAALKRIPERAGKANPALKYYFVMYACIHGGRKFRSTSKGCRPHQR